MNINTLIVTSEYIKSFSTISDNLDDDILTPAIIDAQLTGLQPLIGTNLYDRICEDIENNALTGDYKKLVDNYISQYLLMAVQAELCITNYSKEHNAGPVNYTDLNYQNTSLNELKFIKGYWDEKANFYGNRLTEYLHANHNKYPEYNEQRDCADMTAKGCSVTNYCGINLSRPRTQKRKDR